MVREAQGPDVLILSNRRVPGGVELVTAEDYDEKLLRPAAAPRRPPPPKRDTAELRKALEAARRGQAPRAARMAAAGPAPGASPAAAAAKRETEPGPTGSSELLWTDEKMLERMQEEIQNLRGLLEQQLSGLAWGELGRRTPVAAALLHGLSAQGFAEELCRELVGALPDGLELEGAWRWLREQLAVRLSVARPAPLDSAGGWALVGAPGAGKTSLIAKWAARHALQHGPEEVALISIDQQRIGALSQLRSFARIAGVPLWSAHDRRTLAEALEATEGRALVLVDTAGAAPGAPAEQAQIELLRHFTHRLGLMLVLPANVQLAVVQRSLEHFSSLHLEAAMVTHLDEAGALGPVLSILAGRHLPLAGQSAGQRIPDDLEPPSIEALVGPLGLPARQQHDGGGFARAGGQPLQGA